MIDYYTLPDGRSSLAPATGTLVLPDGGTRHTAATPDDLPPALREEYDLELSAPPPTVPQVLSAKQLRLALHGAGLLGIVDSAIAGLSEPEKSVAQISWEYATEFERDNPLIIAVAYAAEKTDAEIDALFVAGAQL